MLKRIFLIATACCISLCTLQAVPIRANDFTVVAKKAIPAAVSIKVKITSPKQSSYFFNGREYQYDEPMDFEDFFQQFFGGPKRYRERSQPSEIGQASGFIVTPDGYILTNGHVVKGASEILVILNDGRDFAAHVIGIDPNTDIAVIKIDANNLPFLSLGNSDDLEVGQSVLAVGTPFGLQASATAGIVSAKGRNNLDLARIEDFIQTDAAINRGNSGGPLLNMDGEVIGMNTAIATSMGSGGYQGIGFAIPSNLIQRVMNELIAHGSISRGFLGVTLQQITTDLASAFGLNTLDGALIADVTTDSPAQKAGLKQGDVILAYNGQKVTNIAALRNTISLMKPGTTVNLTVLRNGKDMNFILAIGNFPEDQPKLSEHIDKLGFEVENLTPDIARALGYPNLRGVVVSRVEAGSPAAWAGIKKGALILTVNQKEVFTIEQFNKTVKDADSQPILLLIKQGDFTRFVSIK